MNINDIIALSRAGFTKDDIYALIDSNTAQNTVTSTAPVMNSPVSVPVSVHSPQPQPQPQPQTGSSGNTNYGAQNGTQPGTQGQLGTQGQPGTVNSWQYGAGQFQNLPTPGTTQNNPSNSYVPVDTSRAMDVPIGGYPQGAQGQFGAQGQNGVISAIDELKRAIQTQNVLTMTAQMPKAKTTEDVVANIINPPAHVLKAEHVEP